MQRVTNCIVVKDGSILMLQKPRRGWWVVPGGKMEVGESVLEAVKREYREETGLTVIDPKINGIFTIVIKDGDAIQSEWMLFTFKANQFTGVPLEQSPEGKLEWKPIDEVKELPMAAGDRYIFEHLLYNDEPLYGTFHYTPDFQLLSYRLEPNQP
ncbi:8-oxo-dGTP diphosphatase [Alkalihalobacterium chitinilyticum]|uniref:8-oxo-dGTP diphosphatase n=1 Tax=Alkalihalobacterium chitinilyticum TaxID=2980103 RepID=A0ABT5VFK0_9BACI|nr:8-oxo-dGTP diphosphatase [Alkalihalobacterium chitinilyticum]MDE5414107.1 8-oxo-dGTP diphosphatase [Alkalihalobacterium chitinilyticum]